MRLSIDFLSIERAQHNAGPGGCNDEMLCLSRVASPARHSARAGNPTLPSGARACTMRSQMRFKGYTLNDFQLEAADAIADGANVLLSAPTGSGKTLVAEYAIDVAVADRRRVIYTSPIKALSNQKYRDFIADGLDVGLMTGDLTLDAEAQVLIMTTEIFRNAVFEAPERFDDVDFVILDEVHFLDDPDRGTVWEESIIFAPSHVRFIALSATISNLDQFGRWLEQTREHRLAVIRHDERPVPLDHRCFHPAVGFFQLAQRKRAIQTARRAFDRDAGKGHRGRGRSAKFGESRRGSGRDRGRGPRNRQPHPSQLVLDHLEAERLMPVLFFCFSRKECEIKAERNMHRRLLDRREEAGILDLFDEVCAKFELDPDSDPGLRGIERRAARGIGFHHAGMLPIHKEVVERLFTSGLLRALFTTETFALGINMPARTVVFDSLRKFDGVSFDFMAARDYMQMAGRAGRQGIDREGLVISILDDEALLEAPLADLFQGKVEPVTSRFNLSYSTIINLYEHMGDGLVEAYDRSFAAFQAGQGTSAKNRERRRQRARAALRARIAVLREAGYLDDDGLLPRGRIAQQINGYEIQVTELLLSGVLDELDRHRLAAVFCSIVYEARRGAGRGRGTAALGAKLARDVEGAINRFIAIELMHGFEETIKPPDPNLSAAVIAWSEGCSMADFEAIAESDGGDVVRTLRMAIQMMRQLRHALSGDYPLRHRLDEATVSINRDEVDAKRQFELG
ncbi:MAG: DEAD/DEAH box helicase [Planctomycetes bacterium]|nr:DEAD/DEAH box helicase [Planctomycetota bacterium]